MSTLDRLAQGCKAPELEEKIAEAVFGQLPIDPTPVQWRDAKVALQDLFHHYRGINPCRASAFAAVHRCINEVYIDAYERLIELESRPKPPAIPSSLQRKVREKAKTQAAPKADDVETILGEIG